MALRRRKRAARGRAPKRRARRRRKNPRLENHHLDGAELLSDRVIEIAYVHAQDGQEYQHDFARGVRMLLLKDGTVALVRPDGRQLWDEFPA
jgi:hypothetical protein